VIERVHGGRSAVHEKNNPFGLRVQWGFLGASGLFPQQGRPRQVDKETRQRQITKPAAALLQQPAAGMP
jgi:hypothetical protein